MLIPPNWCRSANREGDIPNCRDRSSTVGRCWKTFLETQKISPWYMNVWSRLRGAVDTTKSTALLNYKLQQWLRGCFHPLDAIVQLKIHKGRCVTSNVYSQTKEHATNTYFIYIYIYIYLSVTIHNVVTYWFVNVAAPSYSRQISSD